MQAVAGVEASIAINWNQQSNVHWHSHAQCRRQTYLWQAWLVSARVVLRKDGSNCPAKYTSWPCLAPSCSSAATLIAAWQQWHHHSIPAALPEHLCSIAEAPRNAKIAAIPMPFQLPCPMVISTPSHTSPLPRCSSPEHTKPTDKKTAWKEGRNGPFCIQRFCHRSCAFHDFLLLSTLLAPKDEGNERTRRMKE